MFELLTPRLRLIPLDIENLRLSLHNPRQLEKNLGLERCAGELEGDDREAVEQMLSAAVWDESRYLWHTHWQMAMRSQKRIIGGLCFKGPPNECGEVEVGYGMVPEYQGKGYMSEALSAIVHWALGQPGVRAVIAETDKSNTASHRVLKKVGFAEHLSTDQCLWWRITSCAQDHHPASDLSSPQSNRA